MYKMCIGKIRKKSETLYFPTILMSFGVFLSPYMRVFGFDLLPGFLLYCLL